MDKRPAAGRWIRRVLTAWLAATALESLLLPAALRKPVGVEALRHMNLLRAAVCTVLGTLLLLLAERLLLRRGGEGARVREGLFRWLLPLFFACGAVPVLLAGGFSRLLTGGCLLVLGLLIIYALRGWDASPETGPVGEKPRPVWAWLTALMALGFFAAVSIWTVGRVRAMMTPTYDFGIFSQMFASMRRTGLPVTTLERGYPLSHFAVHVSPIYYLFLPFYLLVPRPETLQVLQAAVMAGAVIPLWKLGGLHGLTGPRRLLLCALLLLAPAFSGGASFDLHENCFLTALLLWLFWALDRGNRPVTALAALLTLCVKEDAAVYVGVIGLWVTLRALLRPERRRQLVTGLLLLTGAALWFIAVTTWLDREGTGVMTWRYSNLDYDCSGSLLTVVKAALLCPMKILQECLQSKKLSYLCMTLGLLLGIPLWTRRYERLLLLLPWLLVNMIPDYVYQYDLFFQYNFGSLACLIYLCCVNLAPRPAKSPLTNTAGAGKPKSADLRGRLRLAALLLAAALSLGFCARKIGPRVLRVSRIWLRREPELKEIRRVLEGIPREASVTASTFYTTALSDRTTLYDAGYVLPEQLLRSDYVVIRPDDKLKSFISSEDVDGAVHFRAALIGAGYRIIQSIPGQLELWQQPDPAP